jgi:hypothetical protein
MFFLTRKEINAGEAISRWCLRLECQRTCPDSRSFYMLAILRESSRSNSKATIKWCTRQEVIAAVSFVWFITWRPGSPWYRKDDGDGKASDGDGESKIEEDLTSTYIARAKRVVDTKPPDPALPRENNDDGRVSNVPVLIPTARRDLDTAELVSKNICGINTNVNASFSNTTGITTIRSNRDGEPAFADHLRPSRHPMNTVNSFTRLVAANLAKAC